MVLEVGSMATKSKAYGYVRVSGATQLAGHGPARQRADIAACAKSQRYELVDYFEDAYTGAEADRPEWVRMMGLMMANGVRVIIVESLDRLARDLAIQTQLLAKTMGAGLTIVAANTGATLSKETLDDNPMLKAMVQMQGIFGELDKAQLVRRLREGKAGARREAKKHGTTWREGRMPFGTKTDEEAETVKRIKSLSRKRKGLGVRSHGEIAGILNEEGHTTRQGRPWNRGTVWAILKRLKAA
jgi:DNA invertase Pin-like site-specific DNA recombinase